MDTRFFVTNSLPPIVPGDPEAVVRAAAEVAAVGPLHDPPLKPRDEAIFLLTAAAEIEQVLMVQYLFAAYSVNPAGTQDQDQKDTLQNVQDLLVEIAREEMGHLITVENLLYLVGGPLHLGRDSTGDTASIAPFTFTLEPLTLDSLAKYVTAEAPGEVPPDFPDADKALLDQIYEQARVANGGQPVHHLGAIFERLRILFETMDDTDVQDDTATSHAHYDDWGYQPADPTMGDNLLVFDFPGENPRDLRDAAAKAVAAIGLQGEGYYVDPNGPASHFQRFFAIYKTVKKLNDANVTVTWPIATNPNTTPEPGPSVNPLPDPAAAGRITDPTAKAWAQLFDLRYRLLLGLLGHFMFLKDPLYTPVDDPRTGDRTERGLLLIWTFNEMRHLKKIASLLVGLPKDPGGTVHAAPPFGMPYSVTLPVVEKLRWRTHLDVSEAAVALVRAKLQPASGVDQDPFLVDLVQQDVDAQAVMRSLANGAGIPPGSLPAGFAKAVTVLEEAVRGFTIGKHKNFWADKNRDTFVTTKVFGKWAFKQDHGVVDPDPAQSELYLRVTNTDVTQRMPKDRPPVPPERVRYLENWIGAGAPDDTPPGAVGVHHEATPGIATTQQQPGGEQPPGDAVGFAKDVKPLFRDFDRKSMLKKFDLYKLEDVRARHEKILEELTSGDMPCDGAWPPAQITVFADWIAGGMQP